MPTRINVAGKTIFAFKAVIEGSIYFASGQGGDATVNSIANAPKAPHKRHVAAAKAVITIVRNKGNGSFRGKAIKGNGELLIAVYAFHIRKANFIAIILTACVSTTVRVEKEEEIARIWHKAFVAFVRAGLAVPFGIVAVAITVVRHDNILRLVVR